MLRTFRVQTDLRLMSFPGTMAGARLSPTAHLLRTSRLFSLPSPLPQPVENFNVTTKYGSDTATLPYPRRAAIETTQSSLPKGDWGLKRALPLKSTTKTTTPLIRIGDVDSIYHITDFDSAADHTQTLRKWQEIGMPISMPSNLPRRATKPGYRGDFQSVFESNIDNTNEAAGELDAQRWKFKGPWLAGQTEGDFQKYVLKTVKKRKLDFREFLRECLSEKTAARQRRDSIEQGQDINHDQIVVSDKSLKVYIQHLRQDPKTLHRLIENFLDLPRILNSAIQDPYESAYQQRTSYRNVSDAHKLYEDGPPSTHPSAGLSYLRTNPHIQNHPVIGPQQYQQPVQARVLVPQTITSQRRKQAHAVLGVGGVAAIDDPRAFFKSGISPGVPTFDPDVPGGAKVWVNIDRAVIDRRGRIRTQTSRTHHHALAIFKGIVKEENVSPNVEGRDRNFPDTTHASSSEHQSRKGVYGLESSSSRSLYGKAKPFKVESLKSTPEDVLELLRSR